MPLDGFIFQGAKEQRERERAIKKHDVSIQRKKNYEKPEDRASIASVNAIIRKTNSDAKEGV